VRAALGALERACERQIEKPFKASERVGMDMGLASFRFLDDVCGSADQAARRAVK